MWLVYLYGDIYIIDVVLCCYVVVLFVINGVER